MAKGCDSSWDFDYKSRVDALVDEGYTVADGLFCREIDGLFCRSSPDSVVRRRCVLSLPSCFVI